MSPSERPDVAEVLAAARVVSIPLRTRFRGVTHREAVVVEGPAGWGEFAPFLEYDDATSARWLAAALEAAWEGHPEPVRETVPVNATVPAVAPDQVPGVLARYDGCAAVKVKVAQAGQTLAEDDARLAAVRDVVGPRTALRIDANGAWSRDDALVALTRLARHDLEYAEQPCADVHDLAALRVCLARAGLDVPVAADESIRRAADPLLVRDLEAADIVVVKVAPLGGVRAALDLVAQAGLPAVVSSALDTSVGIAAGVALAAALPELDHACGLGTVELLVDDVADPRLVPRSGVLGAVDARGLVVDPHALDRRAVDPERDVWWRARLARCHGLLVGRR